MNAFCSNPFNPLLGQEVITLVNEVMAPGNYELEFNGAGLASGVYFCCLRADKFTQTIKILLQK